MKTLATNRKLGRTSDIRLAMLRTLTGKNATYQEMADFLNEQGFTTSRGCSFSKSTVYKLIKRYGL